MWSLRKDGTTESSDDRAVPIVTTCCVCGREFPIPEAYLYVMSTDGVLPEPPQYCPGCRPSRRMPCWGAAR